MTLVQIKGLAKKRQQDIFFVTKYRKTHALAVQWLRFGMLKYVRIIQGYGSLSSSISVTEYVCNQI